LPIAAIGLESRLSKGGSHRGTVQGAIARSPTDFAEALSYFDKRAKKCSKIDVSARRP
jgi:hypothetical protein